MDFLATPDTVTGIAGTNTPGTPTRVGLLTDGTSPNDASKNWAKYYNMLLEEMRNVVVAGGLTPNKDNWHQLLPAIVNIILPIGIIIAFNTAVDPNSLYSGTTWIRYAEGKVGVGYSTQVADPAWTKTLGNEFGEYEHTLLNSELTPHMHGMPQGDPSPTVGGIYTSGDDVTDQPLVATHPTTDSEGGGDPFNIVQPSIVEARWVRTA